MNEVIQRLMQKYNDILESIELIQQSEEESSFTAQLPALIRQKWLLEEIING